MCVPKHLDQLRFDKFLSLAYLLYPLFSWISSSSVSTGLNQILKLRKFTPIPRHMGKLSHSNLFGKCLKIFNWNVCNVARVSKFFFSKSVYAFKVQLWLDFKKSVHKKLTKTYYWMPFSRESVLLCMTHLYSRKKLGCV